MPLDKDILGQDLYDGLNEFNNKSIDEFGDMETKRLAFCKKIAEIVIDHYKNNGVLHVPGTGLIAPPGGGPVTGESVIGTIE